MAVSDYLRPVEHHSMGIPPNVLQQLVRMTEYSPQSMIDLAMRSYENILGHIEKGLRGDVPVQSEQAAAEYVSHLIIDAAFFHHHLRRVGCLIGDFPYDDLAERILPSKKFGQEL